GEVGGAQSGVGVEQVQALRDYLVEGEAGLLWEGRGLGDGAAAEEPLVLAGAGHLVQQVDEDGLAEVWLPLQDDLLRGLDDEAVPDEAARDGVAEGVDAAQALELGPEGDAAFVGDAVALLGGGAAAGL